MNRIKLIKAKLVTPAKLGLAGIGLCALCCALPAISAFLGISSLMAMGTYLDKTGLILIALAIMVFVYTFYKKRQKTKLNRVCNNEACDCKAPGK